MTQEPSAKYKYSPMEAINRISAAQGNYGTLRRARDQWSHVAVTIERAVFCLRRSLVDNRTVLTVDYDTMRATDVLLNFMLIITIFSN